MSRAGKLAPEVNRALFVKNLSYNVTPEELFELFGKFGPIRQVRQGIANNTKGTAFVVYEDVMDAKQACDKLNGYNFQNRYLVVLYHQPEKMAKRACGPPASSITHEVGSTPCRPVIYHHLRTASIVCVVDIDDIVGIVNAVAATTTTKKLTKSSLSDHARGVMPYFVRKLLPTVSEVA
ncbi:pre-mRNA branch site protein [Grosmannia clavigera kw1407]|uniref:Pre-mRNA branch site protein n=1 Tax=Grosmannia clavigera (strain kw1407 / UAMH 11150) TaxID=655863 RepID=F0XKL7_GROCL|nr:pre-mRNA branch site protein [Grosmannia clavigera kw1407]EFX01696.1 pre-mRNA branch site protein [Grosmannia clavigera kw1407]